MTAIPRYGARVIPNTEQTIAAMRAAGQLVDGPHIAQFEKAFATRMGAICCWSPVCRHSPASRGRSRDFAESR